MASQMFQQQGFLSTSSFHDNHQLPLVLYKWEHSPAIASSDALRLQPASHDALLRWHASERLEFFRRKRPAINPHIAELSAE